MNVKLIRQGIGAALAATMLAAGGSAFAQADNSNSATDPTYYGSWYWWNPAPVATPYWRDHDYASPSVTVYGPTVTWRGPAYYEEWRYYDAPVRYYPSPSVTPLGTITDPSYMGPRDVTP